MLSKTFAMFPRAPAIPPFDPANPDHVELARISQKAHSIIANTQLTGSVYKARDMARAAVAARDLKPVLKNIKASAKEERLTDESIEENGLTRPKIVVEAAKQAAVKRSVLVQCVCVSGLFEEIGLLS